MNKYTQGKECVINGKGDLAMVFEARPFIGEKCTIVKKTKAGLIHVVNASGQFYSFPQRNIELKDEK